MIRNFLRVAFEGTLCYGRHCTTMFDEAGVFTRHRRARLDEMEGAFYL